MKRSCPLQAHYSPRLFTDPEVCLLTPGLLIVAFQGTSQSWQELYFTTGLGRGKKKAIADIEALYFFFFFFFTPIIMKAAFLVLAEWSQRDRAAIRKGGGEFSPGQGTCGTQQGEGSYYEK